MAEIIEVAKTGRARCRTCRELIERGMLRFGEEQPSAFAEGMQWVWHHLTCAATKKPVEVRTALAAFEGDVPGRAELEATLAEADQTASVFPYAERASTGRSKCLRCRQPIEKGALRIAILREVEFGGVARPGAGYLHPACAVAHIEQDDLAAALRTNSRGVSEEDFEELQRQMAEPAPAERAAE
jgi:poly [ADP-ribose] polymerase